MAPVLTRLYRRLGRSYPYVFLTIELQSAFLITAATLGLFSFYYDAPTGDYLKILAVSLGLTALAVGITLLRTFPLVRPIKEWLAGSRDAERAQRAWRAAIGLPLSLIRRDVSVPIVVTIVPACIWAVMSFIFPAALIRFSPARLMIFSVTTFLPSSLAKLSLSFTVSFNSAMSLR